jgi:5-deoxy-glucuronate isomerase
MSDVRRANGGHAFGYTEISAMGGLNGDMLMDFGVLRLKKGQTFTDDRPLEKAYLLVYGEIAIKAGAEEKTFSRANCFDVGPYVLHVDRSTAVSIRAIGEDSEVCVMRTDNETAFPTEWYFPSNTADEYRGAGLMGETSTRIVRTVFDKTSAPQSNLVLGEVIGFPGKWSSYPPHHHPQPEIYYYKSNPENGFGYAELGEDVVKVHTNDTVFIRPGLTHPHCTPPGYALWYLWVIRHLDNAPYITPTFVPEHKWVQEKDAKYWPERKGI